MKKVLSVLLTAMTVLNLGLSAFAVDFVPSIEAKTAPEVVEMEYEGEMVGGLIIDGETGEIKEGVPLYNPDDPSTLLELFVISIAEIMEAALPDISEKLLEAMEQIKNAPFVDDLCEGLTEQLQKWIDDFYGDSPDKIGIEDMVITDVFDASLVRDKAWLVHLEEGDKIRFLLKPTFNQGDFFVLLHNTEGTDWQVEPDVVWTEEGYLLVTVDRLSVFAFAVEQKADLAADPNGPTSPQTGNGAGYSTLFAGCAVICAAAAAIFFVKASKRKVKAE